MFELHHLFMAIRHEVLNHVLLTQPVATGDRIVEVMFEAVMGLGHRR